MSQRSSNHDNCETKLCCQEGSVYSQDMLSNSEAAKCLSSLWKQGRIIPLMIYKSYILLMGILQEFRSSTGIRPVAEESYKPGRKRAQGDAKRKARRRGKAEG